MRMTSSLLRIGTVLCSLVALSACNMEVLSPSGYVAEQQRDILLWSTYLMLIIIIPVMALTIWFAWRYRANNKTASYTPDWDHSAKFELAIWAVPLMIIIALGALTWVGTHLLDPYRPLDRISETKPIENQQPLRVQVVALDWKWLFIYPEQGIATVNELAVPVDREIDFQLTSSTVMNAFYIPAMAGMIYAMPGMSSELHGVFNKLGKFQGLSAQYSGAGFSGMRFKAHVLEPAGFDAYISKVKSAGGVLDRPTYLELEAPSENVKPRTFASVETYLFERAVNRCVQEGKMCMAEMMWIDEQGGGGLAAGLHNVKPKENAGRAPFGGQPFDVMSFCNPRALNDLLADMSTPKPNVRVNPAPMRGLGLPQPKGPLFKQPAQFEQTDEVVTFN